MFVKYNEMQPVRKQCVNDTTIVNTLISIINCKCTWLSPEPLEPKMMNNNAYTLMNITGTQ